jgi:UDPglucose 6-dehydrogenase
VDEARSTSTVKEIASMCETVFICVGTPNGPEGEFNGINVLATVIKLNESKYTGLTVIKSTVIPGLTDWFSRQYPLMRFACNPEFLTAGNALEGFLKPDRIVVGCRDDESRNRLGMLYSIGWTSQQDGTEVPIIYCTPLEAELAKHLSNAFLALKVAFSEEATKLTQTLAVGEKQPIDLTRVMGAVGADSRIGVSHILPMGPIALDSPCLPKDLQALIRHLDLRGYDTWFLRAVQHRAVAKQ